MKEPYQVENYRPVSRLRRWLIVALAVATGVSLLTYMLGRRGDIVRNGETLQGEAPLCKPGQTEKCVGGTVMVIVPPSAAPASASAAPGPATRAP